MTEKEELALFWCGLLHPIIYGDMTEKEVRDYLKGASMKTHRLPNGSIKKYHIKTLQRKLKMFKQGGFEHLQRKRRSDVGCSRHSRDYLLKQAIELKKELPDRSAFIINEVLEHLHGQKIPESTLYRHLKLEGATNLKLGVSKQKVRRRWTIDHSNDLWLGDFEEGPYVMVDGETVRTHLSGFIDCHSRYIVSGRYYYRQNLDILIDSLLRGWGEYGIPNEIYLDNAKVYHSKAYKAACYELGIRPVYRTVRDPAPGGLIERFFLTVQKQFESEIRHQNICTLDELNDYFTAWLQTVYHKKIHSETNETPEFRFESGLEARKEVCLNRAIQFFWSKDTRIVNKTFSDVRLNSQYYRVDPKHRGDKVQVRYDPFGDMKSIHIYSEHDEFLCEAEVHKREKGVEIDAYQGGIVKTNPLKMFKEEHKREQDEKITGVDFRKINDSKRWPFIDFVCHLADYSGRKKTISSWSASELEQLQKFWNRIQNLSPSMLSEATSKVHDRNWLTIIQYIQDNS